MTSLRKLLLLLITLILLTNVSYASFPVADTLKVNQDTLQIEEIKKYHDHLIRMGIDLNSCKCNSCRNSIAPLTNNRIQKSDWEKIWLPIIIIIAILSTIFLILVYRYVDKNSGAIALG